MLIYKWLKLNRIYKWHRSTKWHIWKSSLPTCRWATSAAGRLRWSFGAASSLLSCITIHKARFDHKMIPQIYVMTLSMAINSLWASFLFIYLFIYLFHFIIFFYFIFFILFFFFWGGGGGGGGGAVLHTMNILVKYWYQLSKYQKERWRILSPNNFNAVPHQCTNKQIFRLNFVNSKNNKNSTNVSIPW